MRYDKICSDIASRQRTWLVTGAAGFIGSHLVDELLRLNQRVIALDNLSAGKQSNLEKARLFSPQNRYRFFQGDIRDPGLCLRLCRNVDYVLHQAALGSVPRSIEDPVQFHLHNVDGFMNMLVAARDAGVKRLVYASSSSVYGDEPALPKTEGKIGRPLSPYAATKWINEIYAGVFSRTYGLPVTGLRYFNVFGPRQDPNGAYAAVIPKWFSQFAHRKSPQINGDGKTSRDFCYVANVVQVNVLAAYDPRGKLESRRERIYNVACGEQTTLRKLFATIQGLVAERDSRVDRLRPIFKPERRGDVKHSLADITLVKRELGYVPTHSLEEGLQEASAWYSGSKSPLK